MQKVSPPSGAVASDQRPEEPNYHDKSVSTMRRAIAKHVVLSKQTIPHQYSTVEFGLDELLSFRKRVNSDVGDNARVSVNDIFIRAAAIALTQVPGMNVRFDPVSGEAVANDSADISFAVAIPDGLLLPVVFGAEQEGLSSIATKTKDLAQRARSGDLLQEEYEGGYFGISNLGMFGIDQFCAIVSPPQSGIIAIGAGGKL